MEYRAEREACIPCSNKNCFFYDQAFEQNCCGIGEISRDPAPGCCIDYVPEGVEGCKKQISNI